MKSLAKSWFHLDQSNARPGRSIPVLWLRMIANRIRTALYFLLRCPWARRRGMVRIPWGVQIWSPHRDIEFGDRVQFGAGCLILCDASFGDNILVASNVAFIGRDDHPIDRVGRTIWDSPRGDRYKLVVEDDVWVGYGAVVLAGVTLGRGSVIGAGSVVTRDVPRYAVVVGVPARVVRSRFTHDEIIRHEELIGYGTRTYAE